MKIFRFLSAFSFASAIAAVGAFAASTAHALTETARDFGDIVISLLTWAFPRRELPPYAFGVATAPRVTGLSEVRAFRKRLAERWPAQRSRAALSTAYVAT